MKTWQNLKDRFKWGKNLQSNTYSIGIIYLKIQKLSLCMQGKGEELRCHSIDPPSSKYVSLLTRTLLPEPLTHTATFVPKGLRSTPHSY